jgi:hypothetical protein
MEILDFFKIKLSTQANWIGLSEELTGYEREILRTICSEQKRQFIALEVKVEGPGADLEGEFSALDFFSSSKVFYLHLKTDPQKWPDEAKRVWERLVQLSSPQGNWLFVSSESEKFLGTSPLKILNGSACAHSYAWAIYFNEILNAQLNTEKINFLLTQEIEDILQLKHWIELWTLGGDDWARHALGWGDSSVVGTRVFQGDRNFSYEWVDAALSGNKRVFLQLSQQLIEKDGEDPIRLLALLGKSVKISSQLALNEEVVGEPPFLITKLKKLKFRPELLEWWCKCDLSLKSTRADALGLLGQMP